jgi:hypothetical protein
MTDGRVFIARSLSGRQLNRLRRSRHVLPQCSDSVAMGEIADVADARSKRRFWTRTRHHPAQTALNILRPGRNLPAFEAARRCDQHLSPDRGSSPHLAQLVQQGGDAFVSRSALAQS